MNTQTRKAIADTILQQLGGGRFITMVGAKNLSFGEQGELNMQIGRNASKITHVRISLDQGTDTYTMEFFRISMRAKERVKTMHEVSMVYAEDLRGVFEKATGMATSLGSVPGYGYGG